MYRLFWIICIAAGALLLAGCEAGEPATPAQEPAEAPRFTLLDAATTGVDFRNDLTEGPNTNILMYEYFYNGGGVAAADFNQDGLTDLYFTANMADNKLYVNEGDFHFRDVTAQSRAGGRPGPWKTGIAVADVNGDGLPDLYLSYSGMLPPDKRRNQLFINAGSDAEGIPTFTESAAEYGLDLAAFTNQAYFFDYDGDGDLDALMLNHNPKSLPILNVEKTEQLLQIPDPERGLRLYRNDGNRFTDVTEAAGINGSALSYGLGVALSDLDDDGDTDIYVSNDYEVPDYLYLNNGDGTFTDKLGDRLGHTSHFSMGSDIADVNNDGHPDIYTLDMLPADNQRRKLLAADDNRSKHDLNLASGFHHQNMRNMLQLNRGNGTFAEIGQLAGVAATDWSWSALLADLDNDGLKDLHVTNGYVRDYTNLDFIKYMEDFVATRGRLQRSDVLELLKEMPASDVSNYAFRNDGDLTFSDVTADWGLQRPSNSNGAVTVDLDNDGDLDLVVNNLNQPAFLYRNNTGGTHYLQIALEGEGQNTRGIGARVSFELDSITQVQEYYPNRGYLSSGPEVLHFGLGARTRVPRLTVRWPSGRVQTLEQVTADQRLTLRETEAGDSSADPVEYQALFSPVPSPVAYRASISTYRDFDRQPLMPRQLSNDGPVFAVGDVNGDGREDMLIAGSGRGEIRQFTQRPNGGFSQGAPVQLKTGSDLSITALEMADLNGDGHLDVYVGRGGYHALQENSPDLQDEIFLNDGDGKFRSGPSLPNHLAATGAVAIRSSEQGPPVIFVGGHAVPGRYPLSSGSYLLQDDGVGNFTSLASGQSSVLEEMGLVTDAVWHDLDGDADEELVVVGEWMPIKVLGIRNGVLEDRTDRYFTDSPTGWWNTLHVDDLNGDGRPDLVVGNEGSNNLFGVSKERPAVLSYADRDRNGSVDPLLSYYIDDVLYPDLTRDELLNQLSSQRSRYPSYRSYAAVTTSELEEGLPGEAQNLRADRLQTSLFLQSESGRFDPAPLPIEAQFAPVHVIVGLDADRDGNQDLLLLGNETQARVRYGPSDANAGVLLLGKGDGTFTYVPQSRSGLNIRGAVRAATTLNGTLLLGVSKSDVIAYQLTTS
ncbi:VCBS repeat-containing protein [Neolewinella litorea]|uniref:RNA-binding protein n=1 Tax=Neolewinella litorea TaxID=2562452 RepID=A0A4S4NYT0_9BACT|nr:VCBS repeat-containing protein [Neolewinella litorea]THH41430.1 RNA-binding protein [Neolewinella litorea]